MAKNEQLKHYPVLSANERTPILIQQQKSHTVVITGGLTVVSNFGPEPQIVTCPYCKNFVPTQVNSKATTKTHLFALILCMCCCWLCSCCPYIIDSCQDRNHYCPQCKAYLGSYRS